MRNIERNIKKCCEPIIEKMGYDLVDLEYVRENGRCILRFFIGKVGGIDIDDCQKVSEVISNKLDELDPIKESYYLEVSSPGLDRALKTDKDLLRNIGKEIDISLYRAVDESKKYSGELLSYTDDSILIKKDLTEVELKRKDISQIKLAVKL